MSKIRTYIDSGVLIGAARGQAPLSEQALVVLGDPARLLVSSKFTKLEVLPKARYHKQRDEVAFYEAFFSSLDRSRMVAISNALIEAALEEAAVAGLGPVDALHVAAAKRARCTEFITTEKSTKPLFRVTGLVFKSLR